MAPCPGRTRHCPALEPAREESGPRAQSGCRFNGHPPILNLKEARLAETSHNWSCPSCFQECQTGILKTWFRKKKSGKRFAKIWLGTRVCRNQMYGLSC